MKTIETIKRNIERLRNDNPQQAFVAEILNDVLELHEDRLKPVTGVAPTPSPKPPVPREDWMPEDATHVCLYQKQVMCVYRPAPNHWGYEWMEKDGQWTTLSIVDHWDKRKSHNTVFPLADAKKKCLRPLGCDCEACLEQYGPIHPGNVGKEIPPRYSSPRNPSWPANYDPKKHDGDWNLKDDPTDPGCWRIQSGKVTWINAIGEEDFLPVCTPDDIIRQIDEGICVKNQWPIPQQTPAVEEGKAIDAMEEMRKKLEAVIRRNPLFQYWQDAGLFIFSKELLSAIQLEIEKVERENATLKNTVAGQKARVDEYVNTVTRTWHALGITEFSGGKSIWEVAEEQRKELSSKSEELEELKKSAADAQEHKDTAPHSLCDCGVCKSYNIAANKSELLKNLEKALRGIVEIGKRDMSNPKYDDYFDTAKAVLSEAKII